jgi:hypothetical protein
MDQRALASSWRMKLLCGCGSGRDCRHGMPPTACRTWRRRDAEGRTRQGSAWDAPRGACCTTRGRMGGIYMGGGRASTRAVWSVLARCSGVDERLWLQRGLERCRTVVFFDGRRGMRDCRSRRCNHAKGDE